MMPAIRNWTRDEMMKRVAFFRDLKGSKTGLPDTHGNHEWDNDREIHIGSAEHERSVDPEDLLPANLNVDLAIRILRLLAT